MENKISFLKRISTCGIQKYSALLTYAFYVSFIYFILSQTSCSTRDSSEGDNASDTSEVLNKVWEAPDSNLIIQDENGELIAYGRSLIGHTAEYLGPHGSVSNITNGMNCQNCHLRAGTKPFGNNYSAVWSTYPKFRARSGTEETVVKRVNDCINRSLNGKSLDSTSREMQAIIAYIKWLGKDVPKNESPEGVGLVKVPYLNRAADPYLGKMAFEEKCTTCHGMDGQGKLTESGNSYLYPPLWGPNSYNIGAGLYRLSRFAGYVKANMPYGTHYTSPVLSDEECWDIAAYVNSQEHPVKDYSADWPNISKKPVDHPFGPYIDGFSESQHKFGPFGPIEEFYKTRKNL